MHFFSIGNDHPVMYASVIGEESIDTIKSKNLIFLDKILFTSIFGPKAAILNSTVLILVTNNGCVFSYPVKLCMDTPRQVTCQLYNKVVGLMKVKVTHLKQEESDYNDVISALQDSLTAANTGAASRQMSEKSALCICSESRQLMF